MKIEIDLELLSIIDRRALTLNQLPRKKKKRLKKELAILVINIANKEANSLFHNHIQESYNSLLKEIEVVQSQLTSIHEDHSATNQK
jgi:hypothetical protein